MALLAACGDSRDAADDDGGSPAADAGDGSSVAPDGGAADTGTDDTSDSGPTEPSACEAACASLDGCDLGSASCVASCEADLAATETPECRALLNATWECVADLSCDDADAWSSAAGDFYPCVDADQAYAFACGDLGDDIGSFCRQECEANATCDDEATTDIPACIETCLTGFTESFDDSAVCGEAQLAFRECLLEATCEELASGQDADTGRDLCADQDARRRAACGEDADVACVSACDVFDTANQTCGWGLRLQPRQVYHANGSHTTYTPDDATLAFRVQGGSRSLVVQLREGLPTGVDLRFNSDHGVVTVRGLARTQAAALAGQVGTLVEEVAVYRGPDGRFAVPTRHLIVAAAPGEAIEKALQDEGLTLVETFTFRDGRHIVALPDGADAFEVATKVAGMDGVAWAQPDMLRGYDLREVADDPRVADQWHLAGPGTTAALPGTSIQADLAWQIVDGNPDVIVAINDNGVDILHPDLEAVIVEGLGNPTSETELQQLFRDRGGDHGTAVAGVAAAIGNNDEGGAGVCPGCSIMPVLEENFDLSDDSGIAETLSWPAENNAVVINNSWGPQDGSPGIVDPPTEDGGVFVLPAIVEEAITWSVTEARDGRGTSIVFAAGNGNEPVGTDGFASHPLVIGVAAVNDQGRKSWYSDYGEAIDVSAPSDGGRTPGVVTADIRGRSGYSQSDYTDGFGGTSSASPTVAGLIGLMHSANPDLTTDDVRRILQETAETIDRLHGAYNEDEFSIYYGHGRINAYFAVREALGDECRPLDAEVCNGIDDTCDDIVDEGCEPLAVCEPCITDGECGTGVCSVTPNDVGGRCLQPCEGGDDCGAGETCTAGLCLPENGRCDAVLADEECNGVDDTGDGVADEGCRTNDVGEGCYFQSDCDSDAICTGGSCTPRCERDADCGNGICAQAALPDGTISDERVCGFSFQETSCIDFICNGTQIPEQFVGALVDCLNAVNPTGANLCVDARECLPF
jgi:hypothetical protein